MQGVSVSVQSSNNFGGVTNEIGLYSFASEEGQPLELTVAYPGYESQVRFVDNLQKVTFRLVRDDGSSVNYLDMPSGKVAANELTTSAGGTVYTQAQMIGARSFEDFLRSAVPGLNIQSNGGMPGESASMMIRGSRSISSSTYPLLVINGVMIENSSDDGSNISDYFDTALRSVDVKDVESVTVLKSGASIYGSKGSNGAIIITTHRADQSETTVQVTSDFGVNLASEAMSMLSADQNKTYLYEMMASAGMSVNDILTAYPWMSSDPSYAYTDRYNNNTLWQDESLTNSFSQKYHLMVKGGDAAAKYVFALGYTKQGATVESADYNKYHARLSADIKITRVLDLQFDTSYSVATSNIVDDMRSTSTSVLGTSLLKSPLFYPNVIDADGDIYPTYDDIDPLGAANPIALINDMDNTLTSNDFYGSAKAILNISDEVKASHTIGVNFYKMRGTTYVPYYGVGGYDEGDRLSSRYINEYLGVYNDTRVTWTKAIDVAHRLNAYAGFRVSTNSKQQDNMEDYGLSNDEFKSSSTSTAATSNIRKKFINGSNNIWNWMTGYAQANYSWKRLLYADLSIAADASSKFSASNRVQYFPAASGAIRFTSLPSLQNSTWLNELKLRGGWDMTGNDDIGCYTARSYYSTTTYRGYSGIVSSNIGNDDLKNEVTSQFNIGVDFEAFDRRLRISLDAYAAETTDILVESLQDQTVGNQFSYINGATIQDKGIELSIAGTVIRKNDFKWNIGGNFTMLNSVVKEVNGIDSYTIDGGYVAYIEGEAPGAFYGYQANGVYATTAEAQATQIVDADGNYMQGGDMIYTDVNSDNYIDESDMMVIGSALPDFYGSFNTEFTYKKFSLSATIDYSYGNEIFNYVRMQTESMNSFDNQSTAVLNRWTTEGQVTDMPRAVYGDHINSAFSSRWIEDGSYVRVRNITLAYDFNLSKFIKQGQVYLSADNLFTFTKYLGYDPEVGLSGVDYGAIPVTKGVVLGLKLDF